MKTMYVLQRNVTQQECKWLDRDMITGEQVWEYTGVTYGCVSGSGVACCFKSEGPFFELPADALLRTG